MYVYAQFLYLYCLQTSIVLSLLQEDGCGATVRGTAKLYNFTSYNNGIHGVEFSIVGHVQIIGFKVSDNRDNGIEIQETMGDWGGPLITVRLCDNPLACNSCTRHYVCSWPSGQSQVLWYSWDHLHLHTCILLCRTLLWYPTPVLTLAVQGPEASRHPIPEG